MLKWTDDALQTRLARFLATVPEPTSTGAVAGYCLGTSLGSVREQNQDRALFAIASYARASERNFVLGVLCDGMGGLVKGDQAAIIAASTFVSRVLRMAKRPEDERLQAAAIAANDAVYQTFDGKGGATLSAVLVGQKDKWIGVNVGDSRIYGITATRTVVQLSRDDTIAGYLQNDSPPHDHRNQLVQYIGMGEGLEPHILSPRANEFETVLITSDGVHSAPTEAFAKVVMHAKTNLDLVRRLNRLSDDLGGRDNATTLAFPTRLGGLSEDHDQGLNLTFLSATTSFEIWLPTLLEGNHIEPVSSALNDVSDIRPSNEGKPASKRDVRQRAKQRHPKKKKRSSDDPALPLESSERPIVEVHFPKKTRD